LIAAAHPAGTAPFAKGRDEFHDPEGRTLSRETAALYDELLQDRMDSGRVCASLDGIVRMRAVQEFSPGQATGFLFLLKEAIAEELAGEMEQGRLFRQWLEFEARVDRVVSLAFDVYSQCREQVCQLRVKEISTDRDLAFRLLELVEGAGRKRVEAAE